ncbi:MAG: permease-like cell division protein FtsX [Oscillospiraceae bacterium]|nr:permease-like cell division protein FtsX [Oscillospiraceae bacterium]
MKLSRNRTGYYIKEGVSSIFTHGLMSFASICIIIAFLLIMGSFILLAVNINAVIGELENENIILAYIDEYLSLAEARALGAEVSRTPNVSRVNFISREQAMYSFLGRHEDTARFADVDAEWFRHRFEVFVYDVALISDTQHDLLSIYGIRRVNANLTVAQALVTLRTIVTGVSIVIIAVLLAISLFIMSNTIKLATFERREEIAIMRMVGATNAFIRWPFIYEGFILGLIGSMAAFAILMSTYGVLAGRVYEFEAFFLNLVPFSNVSLPIFLLFAAIGFGVGVGGSALALNRYLKV